MIVEMVVHRHYVQGSFNVGCTLYVEQMFAAHFTKVCVLLRGYKIVIGWKCYVWITI